jgi:hypothetical protein
MQARWAKAVKDRDGWRCRDRGVRDADRSDRGAPPQALGAGGDYSLGNGITLCHGHHKEIHRGG